MVEQAKKHGRINRSGQDKALFHRLSLLKTEITHSITVLGTPSKNQCDNSRILINSLQKLFNSSIQSAEIWANCLQVISINNWPREGSAIWKIKNDDRWTRTFMTPLPPPTIRRLLWKNLRNFSLMVVKFLLHFMGGAFKIRKNLRNLNAVKGYCTFTQGD